MMQRPSAHDFPVTPTHPGIIPTVGAPDVMAGASYFAGYTGKLSYTPGESFAVHVATREPNPCHVDIYRVAGCVGSTFEPKLSFVARSGPVEPFRYSQQWPGHRLAPADSDSLGCGWPAHEAFASIPESWHSGLYLAQFNSDSEPSGSLSPHLGQASVFVVRPSRPQSPCLLQVGVSTWAAYHIWERQSLYGGLGSSGEFVYNLRAYRASFQRPGIGLGPFNQSLWGPGKASYTFKFLEWAEHEDVSLDLCTGIDLDQGTVDLDEYKLLLTVGHDEYWTRRQRDAVEQFVSRGGAAAFFGGNLAYVQVRTSGDANAIYCYRRSEGPWGDYSGRGEPLDPLYRDPVTHPDHDNSDVTVEYATPPVERSSITLTGVWTRAMLPLSNEAPGESNPISAGASWWWEDLGGPSRPAQGFVVSMPAHWSLEGTGLALGEVFGEAQRVVGFECDGLDVEIADGRVTPTARDGAMPDTRVIAYADCRDWAEIDYTDGMPEHVPGRMYTEATIGGVVTLVERTNAAGGVVFTAPTTDWVFALVPTIDYVRYTELSPPANPASRSVQQITRNVIARLSLQRAGS
jgi:hypothetical protein